MLRWLIALILYILVKTSLLLYLPPIVYMNVNGIEKEDHKINQELGRVKKYIQKVYKTKNIQKKKKINPI